MANDSSDAAPPELRVLMDADIQFAQPVATAGQPKLESHLLALPGVESVNFAENRLGIRYDAEKINRAKLCDEIVRAGFKVAEAGSAPTSPSIEAPPQPDRNETAARSKSDGDPSRM